MSHKQKRSWTTKTRLEMIQLNLKQQFDALKTFYPNYGRSIEMLRLTIESFKIVDGPSGGIISAG
jgi:hypothetical protein